MDEEGEMKYTVRWNSFIQRWVMEDAKGELKATFPADDEALAHKVVNALNDRGLDVA